VVSRRSKSSINNYPFLHSFFRYTFSLCPLFHYALCCRPSSFERLFAAGYTQQQLVQWLADEHDVAVVDRTMRRRLKEWGLVRNEVACTPTALDSIKNLFHTTTDDDATIAHVLNDQGIQVSER
jgi:hypothetical protein